MVASLTAPGTPVNGRGEGKTKSHKDRGLRKTNRKWTQINADEDELITAALSRVQLMDLQVTPRNV